MPCQPRPSNGSILRIALSVVLLITVLPQIPAQEDADYRISRGIELAAEGRREEAIECFNETLRINPLSAGAWYNKGLALYILGRYTEAIKCYDEALEIKD